MQVVEYLREVVVRFCKKQGFESAALELFGSNPNPYGGASIIRNQHLCIARNQHLCDRPEELEGLSAKKLF